MSQGGTHMWSPMSKTRIFCKIEKGYRRLSRIKRAAMWILSQNPSLPSQYYILVSLSTVSEYY